MSKKINKNGYYQPTFDGLEEWLEENKDVRFMTLAEIDEANKKLAELEAKQAYEKKWLEKEYKFYAGSNHGWRFDIVGSGTFGYYKKEGEERLADLFSRYFTTTYDDVSSDEFFKKFFTGFKMSYLRWKRLPPEIRLQNVYMENPYYLKNMPVDAEGYKKLAKKVFKIMIQLDDDEIDKYVDSVEQMYADAGLTSLSEVYKFTQKSKQEIDQDYIKKDAYLSELGEENDDEEGHRSWSYIKDVEKAEKEVKHAKACKKIKESLIPFESISLRQNLTEEEYRKYQYERSHKKASKANKPKDDGISK